MISKRIPGYFWAGLAARFLSAPFLFQWFHPDERQILEFAHFHAHGRLHPFLESGLHLRNQTAPWIFSHWVRFADFLGLDSPWVYLTLIHWTVGLWTGLGFWALLRVFRESFPNDAGTERMLGWFFALFWAFPTIYSRALLESLSFTPAALLCLAVLKWQPFRAGVWAGASAVLRYPSALWSLGAALMSFRNIDRVHQRDLWSGWGKALAGIALAVAVGGLVDLKTYGSFLDSAGAYWSFNRPHGPVEQMFGNDSLVVYVRWFQHLFSPWLGPVFLLVGLYALLRRRALLLFCLPYLIGHVWTPHREPRFMLPLTPFLALAIAECWSAGWRERLARVFEVRPILKKVAWALVGIHLLLNFVWFPLYFWGQWQSGLGVLIRHYRELEREPTDLLLVANPNPVAVVDALLPSNTRWADHQCRWHRPPAAPAPSRIWILAKEAPPECLVLDSEVGASLPVPGSTLERLLRIQTGRLWQCSETSLKAFCPGSILPAAQGEPWRGDRL